MPTEPSSLPHSAVLSQLEQERLALSEARAALEKSREEFDREREREARAFEEERARFASEQSEIVRIKHQLEEKKSSHERLEREYKLRAQIEFQRFQEDRRAREAGWERERKEIEERLLGREEAFRLQEEQSLRKLQEEKSRLEQMATGIEKTAAARELEINTEEESLRHSQLNLANIQSALAERERQAAATELTAERARLEKDRRELAREAELAKKRVEDKEAAFRSTVILRNEAAGKEKEKLEAQKSAVEKCLSALKQRVEVEQAQLRERMAGEREQIASGFEQQLEEQKRLAGEIAARHAEEIEAVRQEIAEQEAVLAVKQEALETEQQRLEQIGRASRVNPEEFAAQMAAEERRIESRRREIEAALERLRRARTRRNIAIAAGVVIAAGAASVAGYYVKARLIDPRVLPGRQRWDALARERADTLSKNDWPALLRWCAATDEFFEKDAALKSFYQTHRDEVRQTMLKSIQGMLDSRTVPALPADAERLLADLDRFASWNPPPEHALLDARIRMPLLLEKKAPVDALRVYADAIGRFPEIAGSLKQQFDQALEALEQNVARRDGTGDSSATLELLGRLHEAAKSEQEKVFRQRLARLAARISAASHLREGKPLRALAKLTDYASEDAEFAAAVTGEVREIMLVVEKLPSNEWLAAAPLLAKAGSFWKIPKPFMLLAACSPDEQARFDYYRQADEFGDAEARAHVGGYYLQYGLSKGSQEKIANGIAKLHAAADAGSSEAMLLLGDAALSGALGNDRAAQALLWAGKADAKGRPEAKFLTGRALLLQAEEKSTAAPAEARSLFEKSSSILEEAGLHNPKAWFFAAQAAYQLGRFPQMIESLKKGKDAQDPGATYMLALCYLNGQEPLEQNISVGRQLMIDAAKRGHADAIGWCKKNQASY